MTTIAYLLKAIAALVASILVGNWFMDELRKARAMKKPWYQPYLSIPGIIIIVAVIVVPILVWLMKK